MQFSRRRIGAFARALGNNEAEYFDPIIAGYDGYRDVIAPAVFAVVPAQDAQTEAAHDLAPNRLGLLHGIHLELQKPIVANAVVAVASEVTQQRPAGGMLAITLRSQISDNAGLPIAVLTQKLAFLTQRGNAGVSVEQVPPAAQAFELQVLPRDLAEYATVSGDANPIHTDLGYAQKFGYQNPVAQGMLLLGRALSYLEAEQGHYLMPQQIQARFIASVEVPAAGTTVFGVVTRTENQTELTLTHHGNRVVRATFSN